MACVENTPIENDDSEMEEGEIVDDLDDLSDISSEEEFLLRQRLQVLENYNNVLERKKAKNPTYCSGKRKEENFLHDLSEISATELDESFSHVTSKANVIVYKDVKDQRHIKSYHKQKKRKDIAPYNVGRTKDYKKKVHRKKRLEVKVISESSEESDDEYRNKRRKLEDAVTLHREKNDKSSLQDRLQKMLCGNKPLELPKPVTTEDKQTETEVGPKLEDVSCSPIILKADLPNITLDLNEKVLLDGQVNNIAQNAYESIDLCTDDDSTFTKIDKSEDTVDSVTNKKHDVEQEKEAESDSDEDLEMLRQHALQTKASKTKPDQIVPTEPEKPSLMSDDEDSDTAELRLICLKSALLKKAIEMKQKQKLRKRLSQSSNLQDEFLQERDELMDRIEPENNTDIESVDMDIGSDGDEKVKDLCSENVREIVSEMSNVAYDEKMNNIQKENMLNEDELEEDEDLLRARLLTSLSKNLPNLIDPSVISTIEQEIKPENTPPAAPKTQKPENRIIINLGESDSEGEHEATKNLTKMHMKLSEQIDFQQKLDMFLKSTRMEVEGQKLPDAQKPVPKTTEKFVAKTVNHLPKSEQIEYKNLVKRMAELEKIKEARQSSVNLANQLQAKDTLKPRNASLDTSRILVINKLEEQIALSRKTIAEESAKMMKLREEATKLSQKYKIVATELKNIATAITLNKKEQRSVQNKLAKIRIQHQRLLNSSTHKHSKTNGNLLTVNRASNRVVSTAKLQKENNPEDNKNPEVYKSIKVNVVNDRFQNDKFGPNVKLCVKLDFNRSNQKHSERTVDVVNDCEAKDDTENTKEGDISCPVVDKGGGQRSRSSDATNTAEQKNERRKELDDYESPLQALDSANWEGDPNAILCPFEVGGNCKDADCKYLHPKVPSQ